MVAIIAVRTSVYLQSDLFAFLDQLVVDILNGLKPRQLGVMNMMLVTVTERTREIGLRKALGATPRVILMQFLIESILLSLTGGIAGILVGAGGSAIVNRFFPTKVSLLAVLLAFGVSTLVGVIFGILPARKAAKLSPINALRYE